MNVVIAVDYLKTNGKQVERQLPPGLVMSVSRNVYIVLLTYLCFNYKALLRVPVEAKITPQSYEVGYSFHDYWREPQSNR